MTVLPRSRSRSSVEMSRALSPLVQPNRRLVEDVEHADELRADLRRESQRCASPPESRRCRTVERQVADADVVARNVSRCGESP